MREQVEERKFSEDYYLIIDCPPGITRPNNILSDVLSDTGLNVDDFKNTSCSFGEWTFNLYDDKIELFKIHIDYIIEQLKKKYSSGTIRYAEFGCEK
jgi:hypothetical protein